MIGDRISIEFTRLVAEQGREAAWVMHCVFTIACSADLGFGQIGKELGARWRALSDAEKKEYS